ncbi:uncharacterized protein DS421_13g419900 [Arachis hypogaea]|nr:uncharacterized protein DS421_13g419900 [Arachis hypogaea]
MASSRSRRRPGKEQMVTEPPSYDTKRFKSQFHEARYNRLMKTKIVIPEMGFELKEGEYPIMRQITKERRWDLLCRPLTDISAVMIREFYANAVKENENSPSYKSYVRGVEVDFSPPSITRALKLRTITYDELSYEDRLRGDNDPDEILEGLCIEGRDWERDSQGAPSCLKRLDLRPEAKGWYEVVRVSILPTANTSSVIIKRALLTYCILHGGEIGLAQLIADSIQEMAEDTTKSGRLGHPSTILRLCNRAQVLFEDEDTEKVKGTRGITKRKMEGLNEEEEEDQEEERAHRRRRSHRRDEQAQGIIDMSQLQEVLNEISQQNVKAQEQYSRQQELYLQQQEQYLEHREQYSKDREQNEAWQHRMEERLESW